MLGEHLGWCTFEFDVSSFHDDDAVRVERIIHEMRDVHDGDALVATISDDILDREPPAGVEHGRGLVEYEDARSHGQRARNGNALALPAG